MESSYVPPEETEELPAVSASIPTIPPVRLLKAPAEPEPEEVVAGPAPQVEEVRERPGRRDAWWISQFGPSFSLKVLGCLGTSIVRFERKGAHDPLPILRATRVDMFGLLMKTFA